MDHSSGRTKQLKQAKKVLEAAPIQDPQECAHIHQKEAEVKFEQLEKLMGEGKLLPPAIVVAASAPDEAHFETESLQQV